MTEIWSTIEEQARRRRPKIGIGVLKSTDKMKEHLAMGSQYADVIVVGTQLNGYEWEDNGEGHGNAALLVSQLKDGNLDGIVRGHFDQDIFYGELRNAFGYDQIHAMSLMKTLESHEFFLGPGTLYEGDSVEEKLSFIEQALPLLDQWGVKLRFGIHGRFTAEYTESGHGKKVSTDDSERLVQCLKDRGFEATFYGRRIEEAIRHSNFFVPCDGFTGNMVYRTLLYVGGTSDLGCPYLMQEAVVGGSQYNDRFGTHIIMAAARANR